MSECNLCGGSLGRVVYPFGTRWSGRTFRYRKCQTCRSSIVDPYPGDDDFAAMYRQESYHDDFYGNVDEEVTEPAFNSFRSKLPANATILDFGCGNGAFLRQAAGAGFTVHGVELDREAQRIAAANSGCRVASLEELIREGRRYDVIHLGDVLEHLPRPAETLAELEQLLAPDGYYFLEGPIEDNASLVFAASKLFGHLKSALGLPVLADLPPYHLFRTSWHAQRRFLECRMGYRIMHYRVFETGWPYLQPGDRLRSPRSPSHALRMAIGEASRWLAALTRPLGLALGNRFAALAIPNQQAEISTGRRF